MVKPYSACNIVQLLVCEKDILALEKFFQRISVLGFHCFAYTVRTYFLNDFFQRHHNNCFEMNLCDRKAKNLLPGVIDQHLCALDQTCHCRGRFQELCFFVHSSVPDPLFFLVILYSFRRISGNCLMAMEDNQMEDDHMGGQSRGRPTYRHRQNVYSIYLVLPKYI